MIEKKRNCLQFNIVVYQVTNTHGNIPTAKNTLLFQSFLLGSFNINLYKVIG